MFTAWLLFDSLYATVLNKSEFARIGSSRILKALVQFEDSVSVDSAVTSAVEDSNLHSLNQKEKKVKLMTLTKLNSIIAKVASQLKIFVYDMPHGYNINALKLLRKSPQL